MEKEHLNPLQETLKACRSSFVMVGLFSMFINMIMIVPAIYMLQVYDRVVTSGSHSTLVMLTLIALLFFLTLGALEIVRSRIMVRVSGKLDLMLSSKAFNASFKRALFSSGRAATAQASQDINGVRQFLTNNALFAFFDTPWVPIYLLVMYAFHPLFGLVGLVSAIILSILAVCNELSTRKLMEAANKNAVAANQYMSTNLRNAEVVDSMGMLSNIRQRWFAKNQEALVQQAKASDRAGAFAGVSKTIRLSVQSMILGLGAYLAINLEITPGLMIAGSILLGRALAPIDQMIGAWKQFGSARTQYSRIKELFEKIPEDPEVMSLPEPTGQLSIEGVIITPPGSKEPVIKGISFALGKGEVLGIIGPSASGKSTLARAILGIWPALKGHVRLDGADIFRWDREELGPHVGYLPQDIELFDGTVSENIARFGEVDPEAVVAAAQAAGVHELILRLPHGYDTRIGTSGSALSGGQRQRIGLARALYGQPKLVILDEPNSNLDDAGDKALAVAVHNLKAQGTTVVLISHRHTILSQVDKILLMSDGIAAAFGPRDEVLGKMKQAQQQLAQQMAQKKEAAQKAAQAANPVISIKPA